MGYSPWGHKELNMIEGLTLSLSQVPNITAKMSIKKNTHTRNQENNLKEKRRLSDTNNEM